MLNAPFSLTFSAGNGIGFDICTASPIFSSISAYIVGQAKQASEYLIYTHFNEYNIPYSFFF